MTTFRGIAGIHMQNYRWYKSPLPRWMIDLRKAINISPKAVIKPTRMRILGQSNRGIIGNISNSEFSFLKKLLPM